MAATGALFALFVAGLGVGGAAGSALIGGTTGLLVGAGTALILSGFAYWFLARALNSTATAGGRVWHDESTVNRIPIQRFAALNPALGVALYTGAIGRATAGWFGCLLFVIAVVAALVLYRRFLNRQRLALLAPRRDYATAHGLHYRDSDLLAVDGRWTDLYPTAAALAPAGVLGGEIDGLPYTVFDTMQLSEDGRTVGVAAREQVRRTVWVIHLPAAYPRLRLTHARLSRFMNTTRRRESAEAATLEAADTAFHEAALAAGVLPYTLQHDLSDWWLEGRDLITARTAPATGQPFPPADLITVATTLAGLARLFTSPPLDAYGTTPQHGVPYADTSPRP
ncbi:hypothetical protein GCM10025331_77990 [Actinoplanes utahensis]|uniref:Uncharacterized protein n=2 Tax=Actinoplanes utahensis TaxID=1869 RepID=A0A0A6UKI1_ACTUT|nr:hypothetical protein MB27_20145 [Actinoplanes utahensis]GIF35057.1 hypothetical protein Aut01nite_80430 [Actinoplanes utahensis]